MYEMVGLQSFFEIVKVYKRRSACASVGNGSVLARVKDIKSGDGRIYLIVNKADPNFS
jgi:hypothetical protein